MTAARKGDYELAARYLNYPAHDRHVEDLARQLSIVLDRRLPARLINLSDKPEGSLSDRLHPDRDLVGTVASANGNVNISLERVDMETSGPVWLFSSTTLKSVPGLYKEIDVVEWNRFFPAFLVTHDIAGIHLFEWILFIVGLPLLYLFTGLLNWTLSPLVGQLRRRWTKQADLPNPKVLSIPVRLLLISVTIRWLLSIAGLTLLARLFGNTVSAILLVIATVWILILLNEHAEGFAGRYFNRRNLTGTSSLLRFGRRLIDVLLVVAGILVILFLLGASPTAGLAGLGIGGIAVALAAQKTLENIIGGTSMIFDQVVRVGDVLKLGDTLGTVDEIGLRSTRIRTLDRTMLSVPNGQIATMNLENLSARDKFWFHPIVNLRYETKLTQLREVVDNMRFTLLQHAAVESSSLRVRLIELAPASLKIEVFAYVKARNWSHFLEIQEGLLFSVMEIVQQSGAKLALPSQTLYVAALSSHSPLGSLLPDGTNGTQRPVQTLPDQQRAPKESLI